MKSTERHEARYQRRKAAREAKRMAYAEKYDDFQRMSSASALLKAHWDARKGVMWKASVARYDMHGFKNSRKSRNYLHAGKDTRQGFYNFQIVERGKPRDVHSLHYSERVIRRSTCINSMVPILAHGLIYDNGASLDGKGVSFAIDRCAKHLHEFWNENQSNDGYALVIDFKKFFDNIQHAPVMTMYDQYFQDEKLNRLCKNFVTATGEKGLYIGPEDSQITAVAYGSAIDHTIKDKWRRKYYARYMDDSYIMGRTKAELIQLRDDLISNVFAEYGIIPNVKKTQIVKLRRGFTFLKTQFILTDTGKVNQKPNRDSIIRQRRKLKSFRRFVDAGEMTMEQVQCSYMSHRGSLEQKAAYHVINSLDSLYFSLLAEKPWTVKKKKKRRKGI